MTDMKDAAREIGKLKKKELVTLSLVAQVAIGMLAAQVIALERGPMTLEELEAAREEMDAETRFQAEAAVNDASAYVESELAK